MCFSCTKDKILHKTADGFETHAQTVFSQYVDQRHSHHSQRPATTDTMGAPYRVLIVVVLVVAVLGTVFRLSPWVSLFCIENDRLAKPRSVNVFSMRLPSETIPERKNSTSHASELSGVVDSMGGSRGYFVGLCNRSYIIPEL